MARQNGDTPDSAPALSVVVPAHHRPVRLRWLLNALEDQTLPPEEFEVVIAHDESEETLAVMRDHPLARAGRIRSVPAGEAGPAVKRNAALREARGRVVVFTDDDCRPPPEWLDRMLVAATHAPGAVVQGTTLADPDEEYLKKIAPWSRTQGIHPPTVAAQTCNIAYPRDLLARLGGFDESFPRPAGEDTDLLFRARAAGAQLVPAPEALTYHAVEDLSLRRRLRAAWVWESLPRVAKRHPELRRHVVLWVFWKPPHLWLPFAIAGLLLSRRSRLALLLAIPYLMHAAPRHGPSPRGRFRSVIELPGRVLVDLVEMAALARGSVRERTLFL